MAIIGARRRRQGLGPWVARQLQSHGAQVVAHLGTSAQTVAAATDELASLAGVHSQGFVEFDQLLEAQRPHALVVLTPPEHHGAWLERALEHGLGVLCEKPLIWGGEAPAERARALVTAFAERGLVLMENCQWPETLPAWDALFPGGRAAPPARFTMRLSPARTGSAMLGDALPHPLSLLQVLAPAEAGLPGDIHFSTTDEQATDLTVTFTWPADSGPVAARVELSLGPEQPREAGWGLDDRYAQRLIRTGDYAQFFASGARLVDLPDPLGLLVGRFVTALSGEAPGEGREDRGVAARRMIQRMDALCVLRDAWTAAD